MLNLEGEKNMNQQKINHHYISSFYLKKFGFETIDNPKTEKQRKKGIRVYALKKEDVLNKKCIVERRNPKTLCSIKGYNTQDQEYRFDRMENICSESIDAIINQKFNSDDIIKVKILIAFFYSNTPDKRRMLTSPMEELMQGPFPKEELKKIESLIGGPFESGIKRKGHATAALTIQLCNQLIAYDYSLAYIDQKENKEFITSDNPVCSIYISSESNFSVRQGWEHFNIDGTINLYRDINEIELPKDMIFYFPINSKTSIFLYRKRNKEETYN